VISHLGEAQNLDAIVVPQIGPDRKSFENARMTMLVPRDTEKFGGLG
jgi:hypothetical protein